MVQGHGVNAYKAPTFETRDHSAGYKKMQSQFKEQERKAAEKANTDKGQNPWGKVFKNEQHFKSLHIC